MAWGFVADPSNLRMWWPRIVRVESIEGPVGEPGTVWTSVLEADSGRRLRLDFGIVSADEPTSITWEHLTSGTGFEGRMPRQETTIQLGPAGEGTVIEVILDAELKGAGRLASPLLRGDQKKVAQKALEALPAALGAFRDTGPR